MRKKAQGLSITTIIVAAIALIVLVVLVAIFTGRIGGFSQGINTVTGDITKTCSDLGGSLVRGSSSEAPACGDGDFSVTSSDSANVPNTICCVSG